MRNLWRHIQSKSSEVKAQYAFLGAGVLTGVIALVWVSTLPSRFSEVTKTDEKSQDEAGQFTELFDQAKTQLGNVIGAKEETTNLDLLGNPESVEEDDAGIPAEYTDVNEASTEEKEVSQNAETPKESTEIVPPETSKDSPRTILIGTSTPKSQGQ